MKKIIYFTFLALIQFINSYGKEENNFLPVAKVIMELKSQNENFHLVNLFNTPESRTVEGIGNFIHLSINQNELQKLYSANYRSIKLAIPLPGRTTINLMLTQHEILTDDFKAMIVDASGEHEVAYNHGIFYYGIIDGYKEKSIVAVSVFNNELAGIISDHYGNWNLGPLGNTENEYAYFNDKSFHLPIEFTCGTIDSDSIKSNHDPLPENLIVPVSKCIRIFFDCDYGLFLARASNTNAVLSYVFSLFNMESTIYGNDGINISISRVVVWTVQDPFGNGTAINCLEDYSDYREDTFPGNLAQLLAVDAGNFGGLAYLDKLCHDYCILPYCHYGPVSYCDIQGNINFSSYTFPTYTWDINVAAHELGHNLGSNHTHWCGWNGGAIDNCNQCWSNPSVPFEGPCSSAPNPPLTGGTIMSYCHGCNAGIDFTAGFGIQPADLIRNKIAGASCPNTCTSLCLTAISVANPVYSGNTIAYQSSDFIYGSGLVSNGANVTFRSGTIILEPGFQAAYQSVFRAYIDPCTIGSSSGNRVVHSAGLRNSDDLTISDKMEITPNPFHSEFEFSVNLGENTKAKLILYNSSGVKIKELFQSSLFKGPSKLIFDGSDLTPGIYMLEINIRDTKSTKRIVKI